MSKPDWGTKRTCQNCSAKYYDLKRSPIVCPKCGTTFNPESLLKSRRRPAKAQEPAKPAVVKAKAPSPEETKEEAAPAEAEAEIETLAESDDDDDKVLEDASELGEDDDMADVVISDDEKDES